MAKRDTIFLHYGPGGNAEIERRLLAEANPEVDFWDQPQLDKRQCTYENLLLGTKKRLRSMSNQGATRIKIWGHSFGCNLALDLAQTESDYIESIRLTSPIALIDKGFYNLARALSKDLKTSPELKNELQQTIEKFDKKSASFWEIVGVIVKDPDFGRIYWPNEKSFKDYLAVASQCQPLNFPMWQAVITDYMTWPHLWQIPKVVKVTVELGEADPYLTSPESETQFWKSKIPHSEILVLKGLGHYPHLQHVSNKN